MMSASLKRVFLQERHFFASLQADPAGIMTLFKTDATGLELQDVIDRRKRAGKNILGTKKPLAWWQPLLVVIPNPSISSWALLRSSLLQRRRLLGQLL